MTQTTIIISNLTKADFVASGSHPLSLTGQIKLAILNLDPVEKGSDFLNTIVHWSELPFLNRIIIIFKTSDAASHAHKYLESLYKNDSPVPLPPTVKLSLQENLLQRSKLSDALAESNELKVNRTLCNFRTKHNGGGKADDYQEPEPKPLDMYEDLLKAGIDISKFNTDEQVQEMRRPSVSDALQGTRLGRSHSVTKTLFKPALLVNTTSTATGAPPPSPTITLDEPF